MGDTYYFGRGSSACFAVELIPGEYARVFVGSNKTCEKGEYVLLARDELLRLSDFFKALWQEHGQNIYVCKLSDDPHDEIFTHNLDFTQIEQT